ncbi:hypothetical protein FPE01S_01_03700 [Flavihumibacter petaseus NBRC 106054]|uniref:DUF5077 domain-containing protein n=2 Tax=Flavihumibacter TaxID=1004301 RepID=A0A0E9MV30_9BACT|nr:hypothetical protein FPE01S_01_03700 [Flavihumibacter petaseus NBRC 106054]
MVLSLFATGQEKSNVIEVPFAGNSWAAQPAGWETWFRTSRAGNVVVYIKGDGKGGKWTFSLNDEKKSVMLPAGDTGFVKVGEWQLADSGYHALFAGALQTRSVYAYGRANSKEHKKPDAKQTGKQGEGQDEEDEEAAAAAKLSESGIKAYRLEGDALSGENNYVKNNEGNYFYWGRRGPSVHLNYMLPKDFAAEWFYNEVTVPEGEDQVGSYFMANGFGEGYFGMQVNSPTERRVLFSVWSPFHTDDPKLIPDSQKIRMLGKGKDVYTGEFGNEGSGGQSFLRFPWKAGRTYGFLLRGVPNGKGMTTYTAWFRDPEAGGAAVNDGWRMIASFQRPGTNTWLTRLHSFLENFIPETGTLSRQVFFGNQWAADASGKWVQLTSAKFTADNTARIGYRKDYAGGSDGKRFYLKNDGFFDHFTPIGSTFQRAAVGSAPAINLKSLPTGN